MAAEAGFVVIGAGGHARVVAAAAGESGLVACGAFERDASRNGEIVEIGGREVSVVAPDDRLFTPGYGIRRAVIGVGVRPRLQDAGTEIRRHIFEMGVAAGLTFPAIVDPSVIRRGSTEIGTGAQVLAGAILQPGVRIGRNAIVNTGARIDHDCLVADHAFVAPGVVLCGAVEIGEGAFVGAGAVVLPGVRIGSGRVIPAGTTVRRSV